MTVIYWSLIMHRVIYGNKYGAKSFEYNGIRYHSKKEAGYAADLDILIRAGEIKSWKRQVKLDLRLNGIHITNYYMDFIITHNDGSEEMVEVKGFETEAWRIKWKLAEAIYSDEYKMTIVK